MMVVAANQVVPIVSEARTLEQFIAPPTSESGPWHEPVVELGSGRGIAVSRARSRSLAASWTTIQSRC